ncbi:MAG: DNA/RNA nuclease SfsA, partial [Deltaproteobacteria bacterium]|nr:DNA/RNA nuclease SfsA [Deltaproteobacteria bacterium]
GASVYLSPSRNPRRRTAYTWEMILINGGWVGINTLIPNKLVAQAAASQALPMFEGVRAVEQEVRVGTRSRLDLKVQLPGGPMYVEVKNVTLVQDGLAKFPDAVTERGSRHFQELIRLQAQGLAGAAVYVVQRQDARAFGPAREIDPHYAELYSKAQASGLLMTALEARVWPQSICLTRELPLLLD